MKTFFAILILAISGINARAGEKVISVTDLNTTTIIGELGTPLHTVHKIECKVVDMSFTGAKADDGRLAFQIITVDGKDRDGKHYIDIPSHHDKQKPQIGMIYRFWAYETIHASGYPTEAFEKLGKLPFATVGLHFRPMLVVLKDLQ